MTASELYVSDTVLLVKESPTPCNYHTTTKERVRYTDGRKHPVTVKKVTPQEMKRLWDKEERNENHKHQQV